MMRGANLWTVRFHSVRANGEFPDSELASLELYRCMERTMSIRVLRAVILMAALFATGANVALAQGTASSGNHTGSGSSRTGGGGPEGSSGGGGK